MKKILLSTLFLAFIGISEIALADTTSVLLIPLRTSSTATNVGMFDPFDGHYIGDLFVDSVNTNDVRFNAISGPDGNIYTSIQTIGEGSSIKVYDNLGNYLYTYADASDGLVFVRGIAFHGDTLFIPDVDHVAAFDGPHSRLPDFITEAGGPMEIFFLEDGRSLVSLDTGSLVRLYNADGTPSTDIFATSGQPSQIQADPQLPGTYLNISFYPTPIGLVVDFDLDGTIHNVVSNIIRGFGVYRLENGNLLITNNGADGGVYELTNAGDTVEVEFSGMRAYWIELCTVEIGGPCGSYAIGDYNGSTAANVADVVDMFSKLKTGGPSYPDLDCECPPGSGNFWPVRADVNASCTFNVADVVSLFSYLKIGSPELAPCELCPPDPPPSPPGGEPPLTVGRGGSHNEERTESGKD